MKAKEKQIKECCKDKHKETERKAEIRKVMYGTWYETEADKEFSIDSFTRSTLSIEEIAQLVEPLKSISPATAKGRSKIFGNNSTMRGGIA